MPFVLIIVSLFFLLFPGHTPIDSTEKEEKSLVEDPLILEALLLDPANILPEYEYDLLECGSP